MVDSAILVRASNQLGEVQADWMPASGIRPLVFDDPVLTWLEFHGREHGFTPDSSPYEFLDFIAARGRQFEDRWIAENVTSPTRVCINDHEVRTSATLDATIRLMDQGVPVIVHPALWWAPERIYGVPDLIVRSDWLVEKFPTMAIEGGPEYVIVDLKFTTELDSKEKTKDLLNYGSQVRLYSAMLGHLQGRMPHAAFIFTRDRLTDPIAVAVQTPIDGPLDTDLAGLREFYLHIKQNGADMLPWLDATMAPNLSNGSDDPWHSAKIKIATERTAGRDPSLVYYISGKTKQTLATAGFPNLQAILEKDPTSIPLESCKGLGEKRSAQIRAIFQANKTGVAVRPERSLIPQRRECEFFVDFEYFTNVNVKFDSQWPRLEGCEIVFMVGVGWEADGKWSFRSFAADAEDPLAERRMFDDAAEFLHETSKGRLGDCDQTALYHWTSAEVWQLKRVCERHGLPADSPLRGLPWVDLNKLFLDGPCAIPGALDFALKHVARALGEHSPAHNVAWPGDLDSGLRAMVMGWRAYEHPKPLESPEMATLQQYLEADCRALWAILSWLRAG